MCGIFFSLSRTKYITPDENTKELLRHRGPDSSGGYRILVPPVSPQDETRPTQIYATLFSTVLSLRGASVVEQPLLDAHTGSFLCWNGEAWGIRDQPVTENDSKTTFDLLLKTSILDATHSREASMIQVVNLLSSVRGPYAFVYYDAGTRYLYFGRDCLGRRSLLRKTSSEDELVLSSVCDNTTGAKWTEVEADGLYVVDLDSETLDKKTELSVTHIPHCRSGEAASNDLTFTLPFPKINIDVQDPLASPTSETIARLKKSLQSSLALRIQHVREAILPETVTDISQEARVAILFSGGLDCTVLARMSHVLLPLHASIDLLNVAFENPRIHSKLEAGSSPFELCPDRITGRSSYAELLRVCTNRHWRFVEVNVPYTETVAHRANVMTLMHPHNTEMDLSISYALYFASRGVGHVRTEHNASTEPYTTTAHVLLSGLGADELFGGYQRHNLAFARQGYSGLVDELKLDFDRLGKRNLGRDDRVISDSGKEVRFPYLDEDFIKLALELPVSVKCDFGKPQLEDSDDPERLLEPGKRILRMLAWDLGMKSVAGEKKRAIQFGARTAKMETGRTKGTQVLS